MLNNNRSNLKLDDRLLLIEIICREKKRFLFSSRHWQMSHSVDQQRPSMVIFIRSSWTKIKSLKLRHFFSFDRKSWRKAAKTHYFQVDHFVGNRKEIEAIGNNILLTFKNYWRQRSMQEKTRWIDRLIQWKTEIFSCWFFAEDFDWWNWQKNRFSRNDRDRWKRIEDASNSFGDGT